jgi:dihydrofolate reductase
MFGKKKQTPQIDQDQLEIIQNAQRRVKQKKRLYIHFVVFLIGSVFLILANTILGIGKDFKLFEINWFVFAILIWLFLFLYHTFNVFVTNKFMGKQWEKEQLDKLISQQKNRIDKIKEKLKEEETQIALREVHNETKVVSKKKNNLTIIVAVGENNAIGKNNQLIWHLSDDLKRFKTLTSGHHIIMGRKTFESFPRPLPNRQHIVITRQKNYTVPDGVQVVNSLQQAIEISKNDPQPFVIGGGEIYRQAIPFANKIELTRIHESFEADTFLPKIDFSVWKETKKSYHNKDESHEHAFTFLTYEKLNG